MASRGTAVARDASATCSRPCPRPKKSWVALLADDRMLLGDPEGRALEVDETTLVLEQLEARTLPLGRSRRRLEILAALPPELRHAVVRFGPAAAGLQHAVERIFPRVHLDVSPDAERGRVGDVRDSRDLRARHVELLDPEEPLLRLGHRDAALWADRRDEQHVR